jgi:putative ribosome biogenesis GTPase RsgA
MAKISEKKSVALVEPKDTQLSNELGQNKSELIQSMTEKQKTETLLILSGDKKGTPTTKRVRQFFESEADSAGMRMVELSKQEKNLNVAFNATSEILKIAGVSKEDARDESLSPIGEEEAELILMRRIRVKVGG